MHHTYIPIRFPFIRQLHLSEPKACWWHLLLIADAQSHFLVKKPFSSKKALFLEKSHFFGKKPFSSKKALFLEKSHFFRKLNFFVLKTFLMKGSTFDKALQWLLLYISILSDKNTLNWGTWETALFSKIEFFRIRNLSTDRFDLRQSLTMASLTYIHSSG